MLAIVFAAVATAQTAESSANTNPASGVTISVAPAARKSESNPGLKVRISITNMTNRILVHSGPETVSQLQIEIHGANGAVRAETDLGCRRHLSTKCGPGVHPGNEASMSALVVMPGKTTSFDYDIGSEYKLDSAQSYTVEVVAKEFYLADAPKSVTDRPWIFRNGLLIHYENYDHIKLDPIRSNTISLQMNN
jgi:hypothetical protein